MKIKLSNGKYTTIDDEFSYLNQYSWYESNGYAVRRFRVKGSKYLGIERMHRVVNKTPEDKLTDHINGDKLDNRKVNLRTVTPQENMQNRRNNKNNTSGYKGVSLEPSGKWRARVQHEGKKLTIGMYTSAEEASTAYERFTKMLWRVKC